MFSWSVVQKSFHRVLNKNQSTVILLKSFKKCLMSSVSNVPLEGKKKGFLIYHNLKFKVWLARCLCGLGVFACGIAVHVANDLSGLATIAEPEVSDKPVSKGSNFYTGSWGKYMPYVYGSTGLLILLLSGKFVNGNVKKMLLDVDRKNVTFISYNLVGKDSIRRFPVKDVLFAGRRVKIKNYSTSYHLMSSGTITNQTLFNFALNNQGVSHKGLKT